MTQSNDNNTCRWAMGRIEPYLDGAVADAELSKFERHVSTCSACADELELARRVVSELRSLPSLHGPDRVVEAAAARALREPLSRRLRGWIDDHVRVAMRPAMAAMLIMVVAVGVFVVAQRDRARQEIAAGGMGGYSEAEIEEARAQTAMAFAYVGKYTLQASRIVTNEVLTDRVIQPVRAAVEESSNEIVDNVFLDPISEAMLMGIFPETKDKNKRSN